MCGERCRWLVMLLRLRVVGRVVCSRLWMWMIILWLCW